jgi:hypothetical protein
VTNESLARTSADALAKLQAALKREGTRKSEMERELGRTTARMQDYERRVSAVQLATTTLTHWVPPISEERWCDQLREWRKLLCDELAELPDRERTAHQSGTFRNLTLSIAMIDGAGGTYGTGYSLETLRLGEMMRIAGHAHIGADVQRNYAGELRWPGSLPEIEQRIARAMQERDDAQAQLDAALREGLSSEVVITAPEEQANI